MMLEPTAGIRLDHSDTTSYPFIELNTSLRMRLLINIFNAYMKLNLYRQALAFRRARL